MKKVLEWSGDSGVDVILDTVGANYLSDNLKVLTIDGRLALIGLMGGSECEIDLGQVLMKRIKIIGSTLRARSVPFKTHLMQELLKKVWPLFETNEIEPIIDKTFRLSEAEEAHEYVASNQSIGKVLLTVEYDL